jgi:RHS repeat-associated protein
MAAIFVLCLLLPVSAYAIPGDADGNGIVNMEDARTIARYVVNEIPAVPNPADADANQDGKIDMEDAFIIAKKVSGQTRIVVVSTLNGSSSVLRLGEIIRIEIFEKFFPFNITRGIVRIVSASTGYDSGDIPLTFERDGRSLYYDWNTAGLAAATDYAITVSLEDRNGSTFGAVRSSRAASQPETVASLTNAIFEPRFLAEVTDAFCPAPGIPLKFRRVVPHDSAHYPYLGPLGRGWVHNYDISLEEYTDGRVAFHGPDGFNRFFQSNGDGTYTSSPGDHGVLVRNPDGTFQLKEKNGFIYRFRPDLRLDYEQDLNGNRVTAVHNDANQLVRIRHSNGESLSLAYNSAGRLVTLTDCAGRVTTYQYDSTNLTLTRVTDPAGNVTDYSYIIGAPYILARQLVCVGSCQPSLLDYRLQSISFPDGTRIQNDFDSEAKLTRQTGAWGANPVQYNYDADSTTDIEDALGGMTTVRIDDEGQPLQVTTADGAQTNFQYDAAANLAQVTDPLSHVTHFSYDGAGNVTQVSNPLGETVQSDYDLRFNEPLSVTNPLGRTTSFAYNSVGNLRATTYPDGSSDGYDYDSAGNLISTTDAAGKMTRYSYNTDGQVTEIQDALGNSTQFSYNPAGDLQNVTDAKGHVVSDTRDILGRVTRRSYPDGSHEDFEYDGAGKMTAFTNRRGERMSFTYDATGRLEWKTYPSGRKLHFLYDGAGYLASVEQVVGSTTTLDTAYERDAMHRVTKMKVPGKAYPESYDVSYAYDAAGRRIFMAYPDGYSLNYSYDAANRLIRISNASDSTIVAYEYDAAGRCTKKTLGNGTYTTYQYDDLDRLVLLVNCSPNGTVQSRFSYTYNAAGIRTSMTTLEGTNDYTYDNTYQLVGVSYPDGRKVGYDFDGVGNRKSTTDNGALTLYSTNNLDQYTQVGSETLDYDADGDLTTRTADTSMTTYGWDADDHLVSVDRNGVHIDYRYDYQGRLVAKTIGGQETRYIWDGINLVAEVDSTGTIVKRYVFGASVDDLVAVTINGTNYWVQLDGIGSAVGITDDGGSVVGTASYDVYGNPRSGTLRRFAGMRWDDDAGLYYARARWYEPALGRFVAMDPLPPPLSLAYVYVGNCPTSYRDPLGLNSSIGGEITKSLIGDIGSWLTDNVNRDLQYFTKTYDPHLYTQFGFSGAQAIRFNIYDKAFKGIQFASTISSIQSYGQTVRDFLSGKSSRADLFHDWALMSGQVLSNFKPLSWLGTALEMWDTVTYGAFYSMFNFLNGLNGGLCPTFVQGGQVDEDRSSNSSNTFVARIEAPWPSSLLRSDIPIYGIASGKDFSHYRVEYGRGSNPSSWHLIGEADKPQESPPDFKDISWMQGDLDLKGNLATWNTGLKNWIHLPWHPQEDTTDLNGVYTLRLTVFGKKGEKAEDRIHVEVGRVVAQCLPGIAISPDKRVVMRFPEQALTHSFRVYTILPLSDVGEKTPEACKGCRTVGDIYSIREAGDRFIKDVSLEFSAREADLKQFNTKNIGIGQYDTVNNKWTMLKTAFDKEIAVYKTELTELPSPKAIYALIYKPAEILSSVSTPSPRVLPPVKPQRPGVLIDDTFENGLGTFKERNRLVGAALSLDRQATPDGSYCLKFENKNFGGNFSSTVLDKPFDIREYGTMTFDYRIGPGVKVDFLLRVNGRWYDLRFTGDPVDFKYRDVNIANLGAIGGIIADNKWHTASVDLRYLLHQQTRYTEVDEIVMANWTVGGYMKLEFGRNPQGATYYMDNFEITGPGEIREDSPVLTVDDFNTDKGRNNLDGASGTYMNPGTRYVETATVDVPSMVADAKRSPVSRNRALAFNFDTTKPDSYGGYWTSISGTSLSDYSVLAFRLYSDKKVPNVVVGIRNKRGIEGRVSIIPYVSATKDGWRNVRIPLTALAGLSDLYSPDVLFFSVSHEDDSGKGSIEIDDLRFERQSYPVIDNFGNFKDRADHDLLGGNYSTYQNGAAAISTMRMKNITKDGSKMLRISYGGSIGLDYGSNGGFSYASWRAGLNGIDARKYKHLVIRIKGQKGGETPNIYLSDSVRRYPLRWKKMPPITREWQTFKLPLAYFGNHGIDLSHLESLEMVFEWTEQTGTVYIDDLAFE